MKCKICRRLGVKLFLKGEKCLGPKCPMIKRPYPPGHKRKRKPLPLSEYGKEMREKQILKRWYNLKEKQFKRYVKEVLSLRGKVEEDLGEVLIKKLEKRLDNVIYRAGLASSRSQARQLVAHSHFLVNGKHAKSPSFEVKKGDEIKVKENSKNKPYFKHIALKLKEYQPPSWILLDKTNLKIKIIGEPSLIEAASPVESISRVFEFYSK